MVMKKKIGKGEGSIDSWFAIDTISDLTRITTEPGQQQHYGWRRTGLTWASEYQKYATTGYQLAQIVPPPNWQSRFPQGQYTEQYPPPDLGKEMERLKVWMSVAALPDFRKLWGRNDDQDLAAGRYRVAIDLSKKQKEVGIMARRATHSLLLFVCV